MTRSDIRFLHGFEARVLEGCDPGMTALNWLRDDEQRTGTKEGCAEGDCGACTVVLARVDEAGLRYQAVNACILFLPQLDGAQLITIEDLRDQSGVLHPIQQAMVDQHGSQCGFCTPGFVMSLFALAKRRTTISRDVICDTLAGNLCRCTGYRPIIDAAMDVLQRPWDDVFDRQEDETVAALNALDTGDALTIEAVGKRYSAPRNIEDFSTLVTKKPDAHLLAGGTDIGLWVTKQHRDLADVIDLTRVAELKRIETTATHLQIGSSVTYQDAEATIRQHWKDFGRLIRRIGGVQVREAGTIGGNIANGSPIGDTMPALIALGASLLLQKGRQRRSLNLEDFYFDYRETALEPGEFVCRIDIPLPRAGSLFKCYKVSKRIDQDISAVMAALALELGADRSVKSIRLGFGGMAAVPKRAVQTERTMIGKPWTMSTVATGQAALEAELAPISDMRASAAYRLTVAGNLLEKFFIETGAEDSPTRIVDLEPTGSRD